MTVKYNKAYLRTHDIDWFLVKEGIRIHLASAGGDIPDPFNDVDRLRSEQKAVFEQPLIYEDRQIWVNYPYLSIRLKDNKKAMDDYIRSFMEMAEKGFVSMDRTDFLNQEDKTYHIVCAPVEILELIKKGESPLVEELQLSEGTAIGCGIQLTELANGAQFYKADIPVSDSGLTPFAYYVFVPYNSDFFYIQFVKKPVPFYSHHGISQCAYYLVGDTERKAELERMMMEIQLKVTFIEHTY